MATDNRWPIIPFRFSEDTLLELDAIMAFHRIDSRAAAATFAIHAVARDIIAKMDAKLEAEIVAIGKARKSAARKKAAKKKGKARATGGP